MANIKLDVLRAAITEAEAKLGNNIVFWGWDDETIQVGIETKEEGVLDYAGYLDEYGFHDKRIKTATRIIKIKTGFVNEKDFSK